MEVFFSGDPSQGWEEMSPQRKENLLEEVKFILEASEAVKIARGVKDGSK